MKDLSMPCRRPHLPIDDVEQQVRELIYDNDTSIILGETGCGKSTQIPQICLNLAGKQRIAVTQPRRVAALSLATRVSEEMASELGDKVGYRVRFESKTSEETAIIYMTDGMLLREAIADGHLSKYSVVVVDEAHERSLHTDVLLNILRLAQSQRKSEGLSPLKIIIMSATMKADLFSEYFDNAPVYLIKGRTFPVEVYYADALDGDSSDYTYNALVTILQVHDQEPITDDILVFLTGREEIELAAKKLRDCNKNLAHKMTVHVLYAALKTSQQQKVFEPAPEGERKIILSTNIAETSLTIPGVRIVIDCGKVKQKTFTANDRINVLRVERISKAQGAQRAGRAGREASGKCFRLYSHKDFDKMESSSVAEILRSNLASVLLELVSMGLRKVSGLRLIEQPSTELFEAAERQLRALGALKPTKPGKKLEMTDHGRVMAKFPVEPEFAKVLLAASDLRCMAEALSVVSMLSSEELFLHSDEEEAQRARSRLSTNEGDHVTMLAAYRLYTNEKKVKKPRELAEWATSSGLNIRALTNAQLVRKQLREIATNEKLNTDTAGSDNERLRRALAIGLFMNACEYDRAHDAYRIILSPSTLVKIHPSSCLARTRPSFIVFSQLLRTTHLFAKDVSVIDRAWVNDAILEYKRKV